MPIQKNLGYHYDEAAMKIMQQHAEQMYPYECCGFLFGKENVIQHVLPVDNKANYLKERRFRILPEDYLEAESYGKSGGVELLGVYHSHPDHPAIPSTTDEEFAWPTFVYPILAVHRGRFTEMRTWLLDPTLQEGFIEQTQFIHSLILN